MSFYVTTPIYYVNDAPHIGHAYTTILCDVLARYHRLFGEDTYFLTGTDEHGLKVQTSADERGVDPLAHCGEYSKRFQDAWSELGIEYDFFIRTTMDFHKEVVSNCLQDLFDKGEIYHGEYEGWYSESEEIFFAEEELVDGKSPLGRDVVLIKEGNYFFKMSKYQDQLKQYIEDHPDFIQPAGKKSEVVGFLKKPLQDLCISRPKNRLSWGVELPFDKDYVTYVWFDALLNYLSAIGYKQTGERAKLLPHWDNAMHVMGKDILTTHSVYWPTMLMALEAPLPKTIYAHGFWLNADEEKMSKSKGDVVSPLDMKEVVGVHGLRYFLVRAMNPANDGQFSKDLLISRVNSELANNLGNLLSRSVGLVGKYFDSKAPEVKARSDQTSALAARVPDLAAAVRSAVEEMVPNRAIEEILAFLSETNKYLDELEPWKAAKAEETKELAAESLYSALEALRIVGILLSPVMPKKMEELLDRIGWNKEPTFKDASVWGLLPSGTEVRVAEPLFPRVEAS